MAAFYIEFVNGIDVSMQNNSVQNNNPDSGHYLCGFDLSGTYHYEDEFIMQEMKFINNTCSSLFGGGIGLWIQNYVQTNNFDNMFSFIFENCLFENNHAVFMLDDDIHFINGKGGAIQIGHATETTTISPTFNHCQFFQNQADNEGGSLSLNVIGKVTIENCTFNQNVAGVNPYQDSIAHDFGGAIIFDADFDDNADHYSEIYCISKTNFINNDAPNATAIYVFKASHTKILIENDCQFIDNGNKNYTIVVNAQEFIIDHSTIQFSNSSQFTACGIKVLRQASIQNVLMLNVNWQDSNSDQRGAVYLADGSGQVSIENCYFTCCGRYLGQDASGINQQVSDSNVIFIRNSFEKVEISNCTFDCCGNRGSRAAILDKGEYSIIENCRFINDPDPSSTYKAGAVHIQSYGLHSIENCTAENSWCDFGAFQYKPEGTKDVEAKFIFKNIFINDVQGIDRIGLNFAFNRNDKIEFENVTIQNVKKNVENSIVGIDLTEDVREFELSGFFFINNTVKSDFSGGSGIFIHASSQETTLKFTNITFDGNTAENNGNEASLSGCGGAWSVGKNDDIKNVRIELTECKFIRNFAERNGGALHLEITYPIFISECIFEGNHADKNGGVVYIEADDENSPKETNISNCLFKNNYASLDSAFYLIATELIHIEISKCEFLDNKDSKNIIYSKSENLKIHDISFEFSDTNTNSRPLFLSSLSKTEVYDVKFIKCSMNEEEGTAIKGDSGALSLDVHDCIFEDCKDAGSSVSCIGSSALFTNIIFNCTSYSQAGLNIQDAADTVKVINCTFTKLKQTNELSISPLCISVSAHNDELVFSNLTFINCSGDNSRCFYISAYKPFIFSNITIQDNNIGNYLGKIDFKGNQESTDVFTFENCNWFNNECNSAYGGGAGLWVAGANKITFLECNFTNNSVLQIKTGEKRPIQSENSAAYYNGDGGGFQLGYSPSLYNSDLEIRNCVFIGNKAFRHGGAIAIQTTKTVRIVNSSFDQNTANYHLGDLTSSELLFENHFDKKSEGRGGAIYINPAFSHSEKQEDSFLSKVEIETCTFNSNTAYDGFGIYIEGDDPGTEFVIYKNIFKDNHRNGNQEDNYITCRAVIASEIAHLYNDKIEEENTFINTNLDKNVKKLLYVDHYGIPVASVAFSESIEFSQTDRFSQSSFFSKSIVFSRSSLFSISSAFSTSYKFSLSTMFTKSSDFTKTNNFTESLVFTQSTEFSKSSNFLESSTFSQSFAFTESSTFSPSNTFTESLTFSPSNVFTQSSSFTQTNINTPIVMTQKITILKSVSLTFVNMKSVSYSISYIASQTYFMSYIANESTYQLVLSQTNYINYFPYIIAYLSPLYVPTFIPVEIPKKKGITAEQLIGVVCGSVSVFFLILSIIIFAVRRTQNKNKSDSDVFDFSYSSEVEEIITGTRETHQLDSIDQTNDISYSEILV